MMQRPVHRRVSFWLGLFVACFIAWGWWDSMNRQMGVQRNFDRDRVGISVIRQGGMSFFFKGLPTFEGYWWKATREPMQEVVGRLQRTGGPDGVLVQVPDAVVLICWSGLWGAWLVWSGGRRVERMKEVVR
jgi:hypothetical protein